MHKKTEQFHKSDGGLDFASVMFVNPYNGISLGHDDFPNNFLGNVMGREEPVVRNCGCVVHFLEFDKLTRAHPQVINMPALEDISEVLSEEKTLESPVFVDDIYP